MDAASELSQLTDLEREFVTLVVRGSTYRRTAERLGVTMNDLEALAKDVFDNVGVRSRAELSLRFGDGSGGLAGDREPRAPRPSSDSASVAAPNDQ